MPPYYSNETSTDPSTTKKGVRESSAEHKSTISSAHLTANKLDTSFEQEEDDEDSEEYKVATSSASGKRKAKEASKSSTSPAIVEETDGLRA